MRRLPLLLGLLLLGCNSGSGRAGGGDTLRVSTSRSTLELFSVQDRRLVEAAVIALPPPGLAPESLPEPASAGARLLVRYCTQCHALPSPAMHGAVDWPGVARRMWVRIDRMQGDLGVSTPSVGERMQLLNYLTAHALRVSLTTLPPGPGRELFELTCSRCHLLPDPGVHSPADWPTVVMRMETNMERMKVRGVTNQEAQQILGYLQMASARR